MYSERLHPAGDQARAGTGNWTLGKVLKVVQKSGGGGGGRTGRSLELHRETIKAVRCGHGTQRGGGEDKHIHELHKLMQQPRTMHGENAEPLFRCGWWTAQSPWLGAGQELPLTWIMMPVIWTLPLSGAALGTHRGPRWQRLSWWNLIGCSQKVGKDGPLSER